MATPIEENTAALEALKEKAASLPEQSSGAELTKMTLSSTAYKTIGIMYYLNGSSYTQFKNLQRNTSISSDNIDFSKGILLTGGYMEQGGISTNQYYFHITVKDGVMEILGTYNIDK